METLLTALMVWASAQTGLPVPDEHPRIHKADRCEINRLYYDNPALECDDDSLNVVAIYDPRFRTMYLPDTWGPDNLYHVSVLLHELVHHMQAEAGIGFDTVVCPGRQIEKPAYDAQIAFLEAAGVDAMETMNLNGLTLLFLTNCDLR